MISRPDYNLLARLVGQKLLAFIGARIFIHDLALVATGMVISHPPDARVKAL